jgi:hypothetical protein
MHEYLLPNSDVTKFVDHVNGNRHDNRMSNLRINSISGNNHNRKKSKNSSSTYIGVSYDQPKDLYEACCGKNYVRLRQVFRNEIEAAICVDIFSKHLYGEFSNHNEISKEDYDTYYQKVYDLVKDRLTPTEN